MAKELASMSLSHRGLFDTRRASRDTRARPWLTNSVLRGLPTTAGAVKVSKDAPLLSKTTSTVQVVADPAPLVTVKRVSEKLSASKIPVLSRRCQSTSLDKGGVRGKDIQTAKPCTVTGMATSASRIPVRSNVSSSGRRPAPLQQVRPSKPVVAYAGLPKDKEVGKDVGTGGRTRTGAIPAYGRHFEEMSIRKCLNPEPIRTHRSDIRVRSILKHRAEPSEETDPRRPRVASVGQGVKPDPTLKKTVTWPDVLATFTPARFWPFEEGWRCQVCGGLGKHESWCRTMEGAKLGLMTGDVWLPEQRSRGHNYLIESGGFLSEQGWKPELPSVSESELFESFPGEFWGLVGSGGIEGSGGCNG